MKKVILMLVVMITTLSSFATDEKVNQKVLNAFQQEFATASEVTWTTASDYYKADFTFNGQHVNAFFSLDGDLLGVTRNITVLDLPMSLQAGLKKSYSDYWISDLFEVSAGEETSYYVTLESADYSTVLKSVGAQGWTTFKKDRKNAQ